MTSFDSRTVVTKTKTKHRCEHCGVEIPIGNSAVKLVGVWDGSFYSCYVHSDCHNLWNHWFQFFGDWGEGMPWAFFEILDWATDKEREETLNSSRGFFPHAICRIEFRLQKDPYD